MSLNQIVAVLQGDSFVHGNLYKKKFARNLSIALIHLNNIIPEVITVFITVFLELESIEVNNIHSFFLTTISIRLILNAAIIIHGLGHAIAIAIVDRNLFFINLVNILENRTICDILKSLVPLNPIFSQNFYPWITSGNQTT
jgi:hypothetical protein